MKLFELLKEDIEPLKLYRDNPGGEWLQNKREDNVAAGRNEWGVPKRFGPVTASWNRRVLLPVDIVAQVPGQRGEQGRRRQDSFDDLVGIMGPSGKLPLFGDNQKQYAPFIMVDQDGKPWTNEGNHRIMVAKHLGWKYIPIELRYFTGGEGEHGKLHPDAVRRWDAEAIQQGFDPVEFNAKTA
jgi:hypothetical protein